MGEPSNVSNRGLPSGVSVNAAAYEGGGVVAALSSDVERRILAGGRGRGVSVIWAASITVVERGRERHCKYYDSGKENGLQ